MLQLELALVQDKLDHDTGDQSKSNGCHEYKVICASSCLQILELLIDWVRCGSNAESKLRVIGCNSENGFVHVLRVESSHILRCHVQKVDD